MRGEAGAPWETRGKEFGQGLTVALCLDSKTVTVCFVLTLGGVGLGITRGGGVDRPLGTAVLSNPKHF